MERSTERILTTHAGSLRRTPTLVEMMASLYRRGQVDQAALSEEIEVSTRRVVGGQMEAGIDIGNDGEQSRESFFTYVQHRLSGFGGEGERPLFKDITSYPSLLQQRMSTPTSSVNLRHPPKAIGEVRHTTLEPIQEECARFAKVYHEQHGRFTETFMTAASPGIVCIAMLNDYYPGYEDYIADVAEALRPEYEYIVSQGYVLQLDCPDLAMERHGTFAERPLEDFLKFVETNISMINRAIRGLPRDRVRLHVCWGNYEGPHNYDVPMAELLPLLYQANVGALLLPFANPRHSWEWRSLKELPPPADMLIIAGVIDTTTNYVEHPEVVAERIERVASAVGDSTRVLAGTDCGFDTSAGSRTVAEEVTWEKLRSLREGAEIATRRLL